MLPAVFELLCISLLREQYQNSWFPVECKAGMSWWCLNNLKMASLAVLVTLEKMGAVALLFFSKMVHGVGSTSRYTAHPLSVLLQTLWDLRVGCIQPFEFWGWLPLGLQLFPSIHLIVFGPNNCIISTPWVMGFIWVFFGLVNSAEIPS